MSVPVSILVLGGFGFYGKRVSKVLSDQGHKVTRGTRSPSGRAGAICIDLSQTDTFTNLDAFDIVVNCTDSVNAPPDNAIKHVLKHGGTWLETGADAVAIDRLLQLDPGPSPIGLVLLGVGIFPGASTALAKAVAQDGPPCTHLELGIQLSPLSGAGKGNCALMAESLFIPATRVEHGQRKTTLTAMGQTTRLPIDGRPRPAVNFALPDTPLIQRATNISFITAYLSIVPSWLRFNFGALAWMAWALRPMQRLVVWALTWQLTAIRAWMLRDVDCPIHIVVFADRNTDKERVRSLSFDNGQEGTAFGVAAAVETYLHQPRPESGIHGLVECYAPETLLEAIQKHTDATIAAT